MSFSSRSSSTKLPSPIAQEKVRPAPAIGSLVADFAPSQPEENLTKRSQEPPEKKPVGSSGSSVWVR